MNENKPSSTWKWALGSVIEKNLTRRKGWRKLDRNALGGSKNGNSI